MGLSLGGWRGVAYGTGGMEGRSMGQDGWRGVAWDRRDGGA